MLVAQQGILFVNTKLVYKNIVCIQVKNYTTRSLKSVLGVPLLIIYVCSRCNMFFSNYNSF